MAIYVDNARVQWRGAYWCHMLADSLDELHAFANSLGVHKRWFHKTASYPHYDITVEMRNVAIQEGALLSANSTIIFQAKLLKNELNAKSDYLKRHANNLKNEANGRQKELFQLFEVTL